MKGVLTKNKYMMDNSILFLLKNIARPFLFSTHNMELISNTYVDFVAEIYKLAYNRTQIRTQIRILK